MFTIGLMRMTPLPELLLATPPRKYIPLQVEPTPVRGGQKPQRSAHRKTDLKPSEITLNSGEGLRAAYYVEDDPASYSSLKQHIRQIDLLFPEWLHVVTPDGALTSYTIDNRPFAVVDKNGVHGVDHEQRVAKVIASAADDPTPAEIFPLVSNYDQVKNLYVPTIGDFLTNMKARAHFIDQLNQFLAGNPSYRGITLNFQEIPSEAQQGYMALLASLYQDFQARKLKLFVNTPVGNDDFDLKYMADHSDGLLLMNYEQHLIGTGPGPVAAQDWFVDNLKNTLKMVPKEKLICSIGSYGYDWEMSLPPVDPKHPGKVPKGFVPQVLSTTEMSTQTAWQAAEDADAQIELDPDTLNVHFAYDDDDANPHVRHQVWFLDAVTVLDEMRAARALGIETFALWRLGSYARYTHEFLAPGKDSTLSPAGAADDFRDPETFERIIFLKQNAAWLLEQDLKRIDPACEIALGTATDPYQPIERKAGITRSLLEVFARKQGYRLGIVTKSTLIERDIDLLVEIGRRNTLTVHITITTPDAKLARKLEPRAPRPDLRFATVRRLREAGIRAGVLCCPLLPGITDSEKAIDGMARRAAAVGASFFAGNPLFLKPCSRPTYFRFVRENFPELVADYESRFGAADFAKPAYSRQMANLVEKACRRHGLPLRFHDPTLPRGESIEPTLHSDAAARIPPQRAAECCQQKLFA